MSDKRGFLLLEVVVSIVIIAVGLVFVTRIYSTARYSIQRSFVLFDSALLLETKMFEFEEKAGIESDFKDSKVFTDNRDYSWQISTSPLPDDTILKQKLEINLVNLEVSRLKDRDERRSYITKYSLTAYLDDRK